MNKNTKHIEQILKCVKSTGNLLEEKTHVNGKVDCEKL